MDTNALVTAIRELAQSQQTIVSLLAGQKSVVGPLGPNSVIITGMIIAAIPGIIGAIVSGFNLVKTNKVERTVNGERIRSQEKEAAMNLEITDLKTSNAVLEERSRGRDVADVRKEVLEIKAVAKEEGKAEADACKESKVNKV